MRQSSVLKCIHAAGLRQWLRLQVICPSHFCSSTTGVLHEVWFWQLGAGPAPPLAAVRVAHSAVTDSSEEPTLAEGTVIAARAAGWFAVSPQGNAVCRRWGAFLCPKFVLSWEKEKKNCSYDWWHCTRAVSKLSLWGYKPLDIANFVY